MGFVKFTRVVALHTLITVRCGCPILFSPILFRELNLVRDSNQSFYSQIHLLRGALNPLTFGKTGRLLAFVGLPRKNVYNKISELAFINLRCGPEIQRALRSRGPGFRVVVLAPPLL